MLIAKSCPIVDKAGLFAGLSINRGSVNPINLHRRVIPYNFMLKYLQSESQNYFRERTYAEVFNSLSNPRQRHNFYTMLLTVHVTHGGDAAVGYLGETAAGKCLDVGALMSALWGVSLQVTPGSEDGKRLTTLVGVLHARNIVDRGQLLTDLPDWVVQGAGLVEVAAAQRRVARVYTKINYQQSKHSLLRENNEGYAKVTLLLVNLRDSHDICLTWQRMLDLVGNFDLDPDRVLDLIVEARTHNHATKGYLRLLENFRRESIAAVVGNKLRVCRGKSIESTVFEKLVYVGPLEGLDGTGEPIEQVISPHLISLCAELIKRETITYDDLLPYLEPGDHAIRHVNSKRVDLALQKIKECFTLNMEELDDAEKLRLANEENLKFEGQLLHSTKLALISQLARLNDWRDFEIAWAPFKDKLDLLLYQPLLKHLLDLLEWAIDPLVRATGYHRFFRTEKPTSVFASGGNGKQHPRIDSLEEGGLAALQKLLSFIGKYVGLRPRLYIKICRLAKREAQEGRGEQMKGIIQGPLMLGSCVAQSNAAMAMELFQVLDCYDYQFRYDCYLRVYQGGMSDCPLVARIFQSIKRRQNIMVNNLSKQNKKHFIRKISKLTHNQALPVFYWIVRRIVMEDYEAVVPQIVAVISNCSPLTLDMAIFVMLYTLNQSKEPPVNAKTHECLPWFKNITTFISNFFRKYLQTDIQPVFDYIIMKTSGTLSSDLDDDELPGDLLKLLHEILNKMHGSVMISEVNKTKYDAIAAGPRLQAEILQLTSQVRAAKKSKVFLQKFFWEKNAVHQDGYSLAFNLLVLLAQKRAELFTKCYIDDIKIVGEILDEYSMLIVQIVRVLLYQAQDYLHYAQLLPKDPVRLLLSDYKLPLEIACEVVRPGVKHIAVMTTEEWSQLTTEFTRAYKECLADQRYLVKSSRLGEKWVGLLSSYKEKVLESLPASFFTAFWFLTLDSVYFPAKSYTEKIDDLKKKIEPSKRGERINEKQMERMRTLLDKLTKQEEAQRKKHADTLSAENLKKLEVEILHSNVDKGRQSIQIFAELFVQTCLLPRMMLDRTEALYCVKFTVEMIKANRMAVTKCIRLLTFIIEFVMRYLPFTTHREASNCISVYLAEILAVFNNWNDPIKLKQDLSKILGVEESSEKKDNYPKLKDYLIILFERVGNTIRGVKEEPYLIKNCLYILEKVDSIPSYKEQADELAQHMNELKQLFPTVDMRTSLDRQIAILTAKKNDLPSRPEEKKAKGDEGKQNQKENTTIVRMIAPSSTLPPVPNVSTASSANNPPIQPQQPVQQPPTQSTPVAPIPPATSSNIPPSNGHKKQSQSKPAQSKFKPEPKPEQKPTAMVEQKPVQKPKSRFTEKPIDKKPEAKTEDRKNEPRRSEGGRFTDEKPQNKPVAITSNAPPKTVKQMRSQMQRQATIQAQQVPQTIQPVTIPPQAATQGPALPALSQGVLPVVATSSQPVPSAANPRQQEAKLTVAPPLRSQRHGSSATIEPTNQHTQTIKQKIETTPIPIPSNQQIKMLPNLPKTPPNLQKPEKERPQKEKAQRERVQKERAQRQKAQKEKVEREKGRREKPSPTPERKKEDRWRDNKDNPKREYPKDRDRQNKDKQRQGRQRDNPNKDRDHHPNRQPRDQPNRDQISRQRDQPNREPHKQSKYVFSREKKSEDRRDQPRKQEKRDRSKERDKNKDRYDKYRRSGSRDKYSRR